jgi:multisubunit Na+/H+ antiporter MnhF subunit
MVFIALVAVLLLLAFAARAGRKSFPSLAIVLGLVALIASVVYGLRALGIG